MAQPLISVIVPVYNMATFLPYCLDSLLHSSYRRMEIICINDGSTDNSEEILAEYASRDARIRVVNKENGGVSQARNLGLEMATGDWIAFVDSDDALHARHFECLLDAWSQTGCRADIVIGGSLWNASDVLPPYDSPLQSENVARFLTWDDMFGNLLVWSYPWGKIIRREMVADVRMPEGIEYSEDECFNMDLLNVKRNPVVLEAKAASYLYRRNPASAVHTKKKAAKIEAQEYMLKQALTYPAKEGRAFTYAVVARSLLWLLEAELSGEERQSQEARCKRLYRHALVAWFCNGFCSAGNRRAFCRFVVARYCPFALQLYSSLRRCKQKACSALHQ